MGYITTLSFNWCIGSTSQLVSFSQFFQIRLLGVGEVSFQSTSRVHFLPCLNPQSNHMGILGGEDIELRQAHLIPFLNSPYDIKSRI